MQIAGYLVNREEGLSGDPGLFYDYILAGNGLFVRAQRPLLTVTVCIAQAQVRGLPPLIERMELPRGRIPRRLYDLALSIFYADPSRERYLAVTWDDGYHLKEPPQERDVGSVRYERLPATVLDIHSHGRISAFFSGTDNRDEQGMGLYLVMGNLSMLWPEVGLRAGVYGYFTSVQMTEVFDV